MCCEQGSKGSKEGFSKHQGVCWRHIGRIITYDYLQIRQRNHFQFLVLVSKVMPCQPSVNLSRNLGKFLNKLSFYPPKLIIASWHHHYKKDWLSLFWYERECLLGRRNQNIPCFSFCGNQNIPFCRNQNSPNISSRSGQLKGIEGRTQMKITESSAVLLQNIAKIANAVQCQS